MCSRKEGFHDGRREKENNFIVQKLEVEVINISGLFTLRPPFSEAVCASRQTHCESTHPFVIQSTFSWIECESLLKKCKISYS